MMLIDGWSELGISIIMMPLFLAVCVSQLCGHRVGSPELYLKMKILTKLQLVNVSHLL